MEFETPEFEAASAAPKNTPNQFAQNVKMGMAVAVGQILIMTAQQGIVALIQKRREKRAEKKATETNDTDR